MNAPTFPTLAHPSATDGEPDRRDVRADVDPARPDAELDRLVALFAHRVGFFARRIERRFGLDPQWRDDLVSAGYWGLLKALRNRRSDAHPHELSAYVSLRVEGAVLDEARSVIGRASQRAECDPDLLDGDRVIEGVSLEWELDRGDEDPEDLADRQGRWQCIERSIDHLDRDHRDLLLAYAEGRSLAEIARRSGRSPGRLQGELARISRAIRARSPELRRLLRHEI